jgi:hypothetical protein
MAISKFTPLNAKKDTGRTIGDNEVAKLANLNRMVDQVNAEFANFNPGGGGSTFTLTTVGTLGSGSSVIWNAGSKVFASTAAGTQTLSVVSYPAISINGSMGFSGTLSSISVSDLVYLEVNISSVNTLVTVDLPGLTTIVSTGMFASLSISGCSSLTTLNIPSLNSIADSIYINWSGNAFSQATIDHILVKFAATTAVNGGLTLNGGTSAAPSATGLAAKATLQSRGWNITTN